MTFITPKSARLSPVNTNTGTKDGMEDNDEIRQRYSEPDTVTMPVDDEIKRTAIEQCVQNELRRYFDMLDGEEPAHLYRMVVKQAECAVVSMVMTECRGNQTRASEWLGISRGNLRTKLASMDK